MNYQDWPKLWRFSSRIKPTSFIECPVCAVLSPVTDWYTERIWSHNNRGNKELVEALFCPDCWEYFESDPPCHLTFEVY